MGVSPDEQRKGIGRALLGRVLEAMSDLGVGDVELTVSPENAGALRLYRSMGFEPDGHVLQDLFGPGESRIRMTRALEARCAAKDEHLLAEASASLSFTNLLTAVSAAALAGLIAVRSSSAVSYWYIIVALLGSVYSSLFYANVSGLVARLRGIRNPTRPLVIGNTVSEYLGVYPLVLSFPLVVFALSQSVLAGALAGVADGVAFALYQLSDFDILGRQSPRWWCWLTVSLVVLTSTAHLVAQALGSQTAQFIICAAATVVLLAITLRGVRGVEH